MFRRRCVVFEGDCIFFQKWIGDILCRRITNNESWLQYLNGCDGEVELNAHVRNDGDLFGNSIMPEEILFEDFTSLICSDIYEYQQVHPHL